MGRHTWKTHIADNMGTDLPIELQYRNMEDTALCYCLLGIQFSLLLKLLILIRIYY